MFMALLVTMLLAAAGDARPATIEIPFRWTPGQIEVQVSVNGSGPFWFLLDSGAEYSILDAELAETRGITKKPRGGGPQFASGATLVMGSVVLRPGEVMVLPLDFRKRGRDIRGVVGYDLFERYVTTIDFRGHRVLLDEPKTFRAPKTATLLPLTFSGRLPVIPITFRPENGETLRANVMVDTGASQAIILRNPYARKNRLFERVVGSESSPTMAMGRQVFARLQVAEMTLARWRFAKPTTSIYQTTRGAGGSADTDGLIGNDVLRRFRVTFDYSRKQFLLEPSGDVDRPRR